MSRDVATEEGRVVLDLREALELAADRRDHHEYPEGGSIVVTGRHHGRSVGSGRKFGNHVCENLTPLERTHRQHMAVPPLLGQVEALALDERERHVDPSRIPVPREFTPGLIHAGRAVHLELFLNHSLSLRFKQRKRARCP